MSKSILTVAVVAQEANNAISCIPWIFLSYGKGDVSEAKAWVRQLREHVIKLNDWTAKVLEELEG